MKKTDNRCMKMAPDLFILYVGDLNRGKRLQKAVRSHGMKISIDTEMRSPNEYANCMPDLVILDGFPESSLAKSAYYQLQDFKAVLFLALNDSPNAIKFLHVNSLSFIRIINRDPESKELVSAIFELIESNRRLRSQHPETTDFEKKSSIFKLINKVIIRAKPAADQGCSCKA